jgi:hypothetical protein
VSSSHARKALRISSGPIASAAHVFIMSAAELKAAPHASIDPAGRAVADRVVRAVPVVPAVRASPVASAGPAVPVEAAPADAVLVQDPAVFADVPVVGREALPAVNQGDWQR